MDTKVCTKCGEEKALTDFHRHKRNKTDGRQSNCKTCRAQYVKENFEKEQKRKKEWYENNKERAKEKNRINYIKNKKERNEKGKEYYYKNKEKLSEKGKEYYNKNREIILEKQKKYVEENRERLLQYKKDYYEKNKEKLAEKSKEYNEKTKNERNKRERLRRKNNPEYKICCNLRKRISKLIRRNQKTGSAIRDLGCTTKELKVYLESQFEPGMSWDNYGLKGWHIDHIKPLSSFDLTDRNQFLEACHYTNLQPLWAEDNLKKGAKYEDG